MSKKSEDDAYQARLAAERLARQRAEFDRAMRERNAERIAKAKAEEQRRRDDNEKFRKRMEEDARRRREENAPPPVSKRPIFVPDEQPITKAPIGSTNPDRSDDKEFVYAQPVPRRGIFDAISEWAGDLSDSVEKHLPGLQQIKERGAEIVLTGRKPRLILMAVGGIAGAILMCLSPLDGNEAWEPIRHSLDNLCGEYTFAVVVGLGALLGLVLPNLVGGTIVSLCRIAAFSIGLTVIAIVLEIVLLIIYLSDYAMTHPASKPTESTNAQPSSNEPAGSK